MYKLVLSLVLIATIICGYILFSIGNVWMWFFWGLSVIECGMFAYIYRKE